jgi:flavin-binding protein dodecin
VIVDFSPPSHIGFDSLKTYFNQSTVIACALLPGNKITRNIAGHGLGSLDKTIAAKVVELIGSSPKSWEDATKNAITEAAKTVRGIKSVYVKRCTAKVEKNKIGEYRAVVKIAFVVKREP